MHNMRTNKRSAQYLVFMIRLVLLRITASSKVSHRIIKVKRTNLDVVNRMGLGQLQLTDLVSARMIS